SSHPARASRSASAARGAAVASWSARGISEIGMNNATGSAARPNDVRRPGRCQAGATSSSAGAAPAQAAAAASTPWRSAADRRRRSEAIARPSSTIADAFSIASFLQLLSEPFPRLRNELGDPLQVRVGEARGLAAEHGGHDLLGGAVEEGHDEGLQGGLARGAAWHLGRVDVAEAGVLGPDVGLLLEHAQPRADRAESGAGRGR